MKLLRLFLIVFCIAGLLGWWHYRRPASPVDDLPAVQFTTLQSLGADGLGLATMVREWPEITAVQYNAQSELLVVEHTMMLSKSKLIQKIGAVTGNTPEEKVFPASGPQCPVPARFILQLPNYMLGFSMLCGSFFLLISGSWLFPVRRLKTTTV